MQYMLWNSFELSHLRFGEENLLGTVDSLSCPFLWPFLYSCLNNKPGLVWDHLFQSCQPSDASATRSRPLAAGPSSQSHQEKTTDSGTTEGMSPCSGSFSSSITISQGYHAESRYTEMSRIPLVVLKRLNQKVVEISLISSILLSPRKSQLLVKPKEEPFFTHFM